jgi:hypothetical protein
MILSPVKKLKLKEKYEKTHVSGQNDHCRQKASNGRSDDVAQVPGKPNDNKGDTEAFPGFEGEIFVDLR